MLMVADDLTVVQENADRVAGILKVMSHPVRLLILCHLRGGELSVHQLEEAAETSQSNMSQHLAKLRLYGLLETRKDANQVFYKIKDENIIEFLSLLKKTFC